jgi:hypothetical protein
MRLYTAEMLSDGQALRTAAFARAAIHTHCRCYRSTSSRFRRHVEKLFSFFAQRLTFF